MYFILKLGRFISVQIILNTGLPTQFDFMKLLLKFHIQISLNPIVDVCNCAGILAEPFDGCESIFDNDENSYKKLEADNGFYPKIHTLEINPQCVDTEEVITFEFFTINN